MCSFVSPETWDWNQFDIYNIHGITAQNTHNYIKTIRYITDIFVFCLRLSFF